jgi:DNA-binding XRE family transcriptional regulator
LGIERLADSPYATQLDFTSKRLLIDITNIPVDFIPMSVKANVIFANEVRRKRHDRHLTQTALAEQIECSQTAISNIERGDLNALSSEKLKVLCRKIGLNSPAVVNIVTVPSYCGNSDCPLGWTDVVNGNLVVQPAIFLVEKDATRFCKGCGQVLLTTCQEPSCSKPVLEGSAFCISCGSPLVKTEKHQQGGDLEEFKERMNQRHREHEAAIKSVEVLK